MNDILKKVKRKFRKAMNEVQGPMQKKSFKNIFEFFLKKFKEIREKIIKTDLNEEDLNILIGYRDFWLENAKKLRNKREFVHADEYQATGELMNKTLDALGTGQHAEALKALDENIVEVEGMIKKYLE